MKVEKQPYEPLIYSFVTREMIEKYRLVPKDEDIESEDDTEDEDKEREEEEKGPKENPIIISDIRKDVFVATQGAQIPIDLVEETKKDARDIKEKYKEGSTDTWVGKFMENPNYYIIDNEGGGDCFFATIRDAFSQIGQQTTVAKLREKLAENATQELFDNYKGQYEDAMKSVVEDSKKIKELEIEYEKFKEKYKATIDREERKKLTDAGKIIKEQRDRIINEKKISQQIANEYKCMKKVNDLLEFKKLIKTCEFWGETWSISTMERVLNIKFILLSQESYKDGDMNNVLNCGQLNDSVLESNGIFEPEYYIIVEYNGYHYKLIGYKTKQIFNFKELPYSVKESVVEKCMERNAGTFSLIPDFVKFKEGIRGKPEEPIARFEELSEAKIKNLYDENIEFHFNSTSTPKKLPGKGVGEKIPADIIREFSDLASIQDWRKKLDDSWIQPFNLDEHGWNSVIHYYHANKFKNSPEFYLSFTSESGSYLSKDVDLAKAAGSKTGKYKKELIRPVEIKIDASFDDENKKMKLIKNAVFAKFSQNEDLKNALISTKNAKLMFSPKGKEPELAETLMLVRDEVKNL